MKAIAIDANIPNIMANALSVLMYWDKSSIIIPAFLILIIEKATEAPSKLKIIETVVETGNPKVLKIFRSKTFERITARNMIMISEKTN